MTLEAAIQEGRLDIVDELLMEEPNRIEESIDGIWIPFYAARLGNFEICKYIVEYTRANYNVVDEKNRTILYYAVESGNLELVRYYVERVGMSPLKGDVNLLTPFEMVHHLAKEHGENSSFAQIETFFEEWVGCKYENMYHNPIRTGMHPDPSIVRVGEDYYMVNSSFVMFPCIPISHSKDLIHWEVIGHAITNPEWAKLDELEGGRGYWAPDISYYEGRFYIAATYRLNDTGNVCRKQMITSSQYPEGPYEEPVFIDEDGIDPSIFTDDDGRRYVVLNRGARIFEISKDGKEKISDAQLLFYGDYKRAPEGSHLLKKDGWYYLFEAEGGTGIGHRITVSRSRTLKGIYEPCPYNPIMRQEDEGAGLQRAGHGKPVMTQKGEWYMVYLCGRQLDHQYTMLGRETALDPITWTPDGWPLVNMRKGPSCLQKKPDLQEWIPTEVRDSIWKACDGNGMLGQEWITARPPVEAGIQIYENHVSLKGSKAPLSSPLARNMLFRRQTAFTFDFQATMVKPELSDGQHAGIIGYYDENSYVRCSLEKNKGFYQIVLQEHVELEDRTVLSIELEAKSIENCQQITFYMNTEGLKRTFAYSLDHAEPIELTCLENVYYLSDEAVPMGKRFTGALAGIYAYAGEEKDLSVDFMALATKDL